MRNRSTRACRAKRKRILRASDICWICDQSGADSVDLVIPVSRGGTDADSNLRSAHLFPRNRSKSDEEYAPGIIRRFGALK